MYCRDVPAERQVACSCACSLLFNASRGPPAELLCALPVRATACFATSRRGRASQGCICGLCVISPETCTAAHDTLPWHVSLSAFAPSLYICVWCLRQAALHRTCFVAVSICQLSSSLYRILAAAGMQEACDCLAAVAAQRRRDRQPGAAC